MAVYHIYHIRFGNTVPPKSSSISFCQFLMFPPQLACQTQHSWEDKGHQGFELLRAVLSVHAKIDEDPTGPMAFPIERHCQPSHQTLQTGLNSCFVGSIQSLVSSGQTPPMRCKTLALHRCDCQDVLMQLSGPETLIAKHHGTIKVKKMMFQTPDLHRVQNPQTSRSHSEASTPSFCTTRRVSWDRDRQKAVAHRRVSVHL